MKFCFNKDVMPTSAGEGAQRKVLAHAPNLMVVEMKFESGAVGAMHSHPHEQATYIVSGSFSFTNDGETHEVRAGDSLSFAPNVVHGVACIEAGCVIDVFTPCREDFL
ncbi:MAG: cupin domain-containing protein [Oscillospiraceae bacterium]|jgi:quercetin dioxygenase-like cupin family protein|nr:cupin domain-containing protein [Oscillospiraceae bacterium]